MYKEQVYERQIFNYPPYYRLIKITLKHKDFEKVKESAMWLYQVLAQNMKIPVLGPEEPMINRIRNEYLRTILIKIPENVSQTETKKTIQKILNSFDVIPQYRSVKRTVNVDFY
jgi:primosomal protein N' (replication factor Y)